MKKPDYITQINLFHDWCKTHHPPPLAKLLWFELIHQNNLSGWKEWFEVSTSQLVSEMDIGRRTLIRMRQTLIDEKLIEYEEGAKRRPSRYKINFLARNKIGSGELVSPAIQSNTQKHAANSKKDNEIVRQFGTATDTENNEIVCQNGTENSDIVCQFGTEYESETGQNQNSVSDSVSDSVPKGNNIWHRIQDSSLYNYKTETETENTHTCVSPPDTNKTENKKKNQRLDYLAVMEFWNSHHGDMPQIKVMTDARKKSLRSIAEKYSTETLQEVILKAEESDFMNGRSGGRRWKASFDWIIKPANFVKVLEGNYDNKNQTNSGLTSGIVSDYCMNMALFGEETGGYDDKAGGGSGNGGNSSELSGVSFEVE